MQTDKFCNLSMFFVFPTLENNQMVA